MSEKESIRLRIFNAVFGVITAILLCYFIAENYVAYWYLKDHYKTTVGTIVAKEDFSNGGVTYRYEYEVDGLKYSETGICRDDRKPPVIGKSYVVKYLEFMPSISSGEY
jgi:hypothetical protein